MGFFHATKKGITYANLIDKKTFVPLLYRMNIGGSIRLNPCGLLLLGLMSLFILYYTFGSSNSKAEESVSMKVLLSAAIDIAKKGGHEVRRIRDQVIFC